MTNRAIFYRDAKYLELKTKANLAFVGMKDNFTNENLYFEYDISEEEFDEKVAKLSTFFLKMTQYILLNTNIISS